MNAIKVVLVLGLMACTGRQAPADDAGAVPGDAAVDAGSLDTGSAIDAGSCVDAGNPCTSDEIRQQDRPCMPWEEQCRRIQTCGSDRPVQCRAAISCLAIPGCEPGARSSQIGCGLDETDCSTETVCGSTIFCRPDRDCAEPTCPPDRLTSTVPCGRGEPDCVGIYDCGQAFWCRVDPGCDGVPACNRGIATTYPCVEGERFCERVTTCGASVFCRY
jgi:hypothetical protein